MTTEKDTSTQAVEAQAVVYDESKIRHLEDTEHIRTRPGMYIGRLGDGSHAEDGIYVLLKESIDNSIDELEFVRRSVRSFSTSICEITICGSIEKRSLCESKTPFS